LPPKKKISVLIVEDSALIAIDVEALVQNAGYCVLGPVNSVGAAFALLENHEPDIALLDINLGTSNVFDLADFLVERNTRLIFLSGHSGDMLPEAHRHWRLIGKPFLPEEVLKALKEESAA
jgi:two-component SAPR family response regulator